MKQDILKVGAWGVSVRFYRTLTPQDIFLSPALRGALFSALEGVGDTGGGGDFEKAVMKERRFIDNPGESLYNCVRLSPG